MDHSRSVMKEIPVTPSLYFPFSLSMQTSLLSPAALCLAPQGPGNDSCDRQEAGCVSKFTWYITVCDGCIAAKQSNTWWTETLSPPSWVVITPAMGASAALLIGRGRIQGNHRPFKHILNRTVGKGECAVWENQQCCWKTPAKILAFIWILGNQFLSNMLLGWSSLMSAVWYNFQWPWPLFRVTIVSENEILAHLLENDQLIWMKFSVLRQTCWFVEAL